MPHTRAQATGLLNQAEMGLFDDSRANALKGLSARQLESHLVRARKARDRARDLVQRQALAERKRSGSKRGASGRAGQRSRRKAELLADVLKRYEAQLKLAGKRERAESAARPAKTPGKAAKTDRKTSKAAKKTSKSAKTSRAAKKSTNAAKTSKAAKKTSKAAKTSKDARNTAKSAKKPDARRTRPITPRRALANTRKLLQAKQAQDRQPQPWQTLDPHQEHLTQAGYQSPEAADKAQALHAGESRMTPIQGSISTRDRRNQGRRDHRQDSE